MKRFYGNVEIDLPSVLWIFDDWKAHPIYHRADLVTFPNGEGAHVVTGCGRKTNDRPGGYRSALGINPRHAVRFARPCSVCWPQLRAQRSIFQKLRVKMTNNVQQEIA